MILKQLSRFNVDDSGLVRVVTATAAGMETQVTTSEGWVSDCARDQRPSHTSRPRDTERKYITAGNTRTMLGGR